MSPQINPSAAKKPQMKRSVIGAVLSALFMGLGQLYNRQYMKGILYAVLELFIIVVWYKPIMNGLWGLYTLGEQQQVRGARGRITEQGDHSIFLMIEGVIVVLVLLVILLVYIRNIIDAYKTGKMIDEGGQPKTFAESMRNAWDNGYAYILLTPAFFFTLFLTVLPLVFGILIAFTNYAAPVLPPLRLVDWVGFQTFINLFRLEIWSNTFYGVLWWTIIWSILATITTFFVGLFYAVIINHKRIRYKKLWRTIFILPWAIPQFISILIFRNIFNGQFGPINQYLVKLGLDPIPWLSDPTWAKIALVMVNIWFGFPFWMALMSGVLTSIDRDMFEAAEVDGANGWQKFWKISFPLVMFATAPLLIMGFAGNFNNFNMIYLFTQGGPANIAYSYAGSTDILISWIYKLTLEQNQYNMASVVSILIFVIVAIFSIYNFRKTRAFKEEDMIQ
ncbi:sugar ABC transporter permease [Paenibacillus abyssi]|nr:sugar ABC transporter permease [Paenibacillus abyssi]